MDGERVEETWRHVLVRDGSRCLLSDLLIYAEVTLYPPDGTSGVGPRQASWRFTEPRDAMTSDDFLCRVPEQPAVPAVPV